MKLNEAEDIPIDLALTREEREQVAHQFVRVIAAMRVCSDRITEAADNFEALLACIIEPETEEDSDGEA